MHKHFKATVCTVIDITKGWDGATTWCATLHVKYMARLLHLTRESNLFAIQACAKCHATNQISWCK